MRASNGSTSLGHEAGQLGSARSAYKHEGSQTEAMTRHACFRQRPGSPLLHHRTRTRCADSTPITCTWLSYTKTQEVRRGLAEICDVVSFNIYAPLPSQGAWRRPSRFDKDPWHSRSEVPFRALDRGMFPSPDWWPRPRSGRPGPPLYRNYCTTPWTIPPGRLPLVPVSRSTLTGRQ